MKLYHFCSRHHIEQIKKQGLTLGRIPIPDITLQQVNGFVKPCQWLTENPDFIQSWEQYSSLPYRRNDYRITIKIPKGHRDKLHRWEGICESTARLKRAAMILNMFGDPENWWCYMARVKPNWFREIKSHPKRNLNEKIKEGTPEDS